MTIRVVAILISAMTIAFTGDQVVRAQAPSVSCAVEGAGDGLSVDKPVIHENLKRVPLAITVRLNGLDGDELRTEGSDNTPATILLQAQQVSGAVRQTVEHKIAVVGTSQTPEHLGLRLLFEVPVAAVERTQAIQEYLVHVEQTERARTLPDSEGLQLLAARRAQVTAALERLYVQNRVGLFAITCEYVSSAAGKWNGRVTSAPLYVSIRDVGKFFDQPAYRPQ